MNYFKGWVIRDVRPILQCLLLLFSSLSMVLSSGADALAKDLLNRTLNTSSLFVINDKQGEIRLTGFGDRTTHFNITYKMKGFYIVAVPALRMMLDSGVQPSMLKRLKFEDRYYIIPQKATISGIVNFVTGFSTTPPNETCTEQHIKARIYKNFEAPSEKELKEMLKGHSLKREGLDILFRKLAPSSYLCSMVIHDSRAIGGQIYLTAQCSELATHIGESRPQYDTYGVGTYRYFLGPGKLYAYKEKPATLSWAFYLTDGLKSRFCEVDCFRYHNITGTKNKTANNDLEFTHNKRFLLPDDFSINDMDISGHFSAEARGSIPGCSYLDWDRIIKANLDFWIGATMTIDAKLMPAQKGESAVLPKPGDKRKYKLILKNPNHEGVQAVRFRLINVSSYPGIATNAGNHKLHSVCPDCIAGKKVKQYNLETYWNNMTITRHYNFYSECPVDKLPDLYFTDIDNPDFEVNGTVYTEGLKYKAANQLILENPQKDEITVTMRVMDSAAKGQIAADVLINGIWYGANATGLTATSDHSCLTFPYDLDKDGIHDDWEDVYKFSSLREDRDTHIKDKHRGDGLSYFEEYRGVYSLGHLLRTNPTRKTIFVHPYSGRFIPELQLLKRVFASNKAHLELVILDEDEMKDDIVNFQGSMGFDEEFKNRGSKSKQYAIVVMDYDDQIWAYRFFNKNGRWDFAGLASDVSPPGIKNNTVVIWWQKVPSDELVGLIAHELGHKMNIHHHGDTEYFVNFKNHGKLWVALKGGQHSGDIFSFMMYKIADKLCESRTMNCDYGELKDFPTHLINRRAFTALTESGFNVNGNYAGKASQPSDLEQLNIKSY